MAKVSELVDKINKDYKRPIASIGAERAGCERIPTGIFQFDLQSGGGFCKGRVNLVYGPESSMKTSLCFAAIGSIQKSDPDKTAVFVDIEGHFDASWAVHFGVDCQKLAYVAPTSAEEMIDTVEQLMYAEDISIICLDSLAAMVTTAELQSSAEKAVVGNAGLAVNKLYRKTSRALSAAKELGTEPTLLLINQTRHKIGVNFGDPETMPGGSSFKFASSLTVRVYGKDEFAHKGDALPTYKKVSTIIKKWKVPIVARNGEMYIAIQPVPEYGLQIGESYDWGTVLSYMKKLGMIQKSKDGWDHVDLDTGEIVCTYPTQDAWKERMFTDREYGAGVKAQVIAGVLAGAHLIEPD